MSKKKNKKEWDEIEDLVMIYKRQFDDDCTAEEEVESQDAALELINRFSPLIKKYIRLLKGGDINFFDSEMKMFVYLFIDDKNLQKELRKKIQTSSGRKEINNKFNFIRETYGALTEDEITVDLQILLLTLARRYKQKGRSFCGYLYNSFKFEVARFIKKYINDPINISYKMSEYISNLNGELDENIEEAYEDNYYENQLGLPNLEWINGSACSECFEGLTNLERKLLVKYYLEDWNDRQISDAIGIGISTVNSTRRDAALKVAESMGLTEDDIVRRRKLGSPTIDNQKS